MQGDPILVPLTGLVEGVCRIPKQAIQLKETRSALVAKNDGKFDIHVGGTRFHDLRHTHATQLLKEGVHPKVAQERLGHATIAVTLDLYSHVMPGMQEDAALRVDTALRAALGKRDKTDI